MVIKDQTPISSFLSLEKDMGIIANKMLNNQRIQKLLHYNTRDALKKPNLTQEESLALFGKNIKLVPKLTINSEVMNQIVVCFDEFTPNNTNPHYRNNTIAFNIICHFDQWQLNDFQLRPYRIAAELDSMFNDTHLSGIGTLQFAGAAQQVYTPELAGVTIVYDAIHGDEDKKNMPNPQDQIQFEKDFYEMMGLNE